MIKYESDTGNNKVIANMPAILKRIIVGENEVGGTVVVSDDKADGSANVKISLAGDTLQGVYNVDAVFRKGITANLGGGQAKVTFIYEPTSV